MIGVLIVVGLVITVVFSTALGLRNSEIQVLKGTLADKDYTLYKRKVEFEELLHRYREVSRSKFQGFDSVVGVLSSEPDRPVITIPEYQMDMGSYIKSNVLPTEESPMATVTYLNFERIALRRNGKEFTAWRRGNWVLMPYQYLLGGNDVY